MSPLHRQPYKYRGTIIVDANVLNHLFCEVKDEFKNPAYRKEKAALNDPQSKRIKHYLGILEFLGKHGFHIVIPEIVAAETGSVLASGTALMDYANIPESERPLFYNPQLVKILQKVARNHYIDVVIVENPERSAHPDAQQAARHARHLKAIRKHPPGSNEARDALIKLLKQSGRDVGEKAILGYIIDSAQTKHGDVFVLGDDTKALEKIGKECGVPVFNTNGLLRPIISSGLHKAMGLAEDIKANDIQRECSARREAISKHKQTPIRRWMDQRWKTPDAEPQYDIFKQKIEELAKDMEISSWQERIKSQPDKDKGNRPR